MAVVVVAADDTSVVELREVAGSAAVVVRLMGAPPWGRARSRRTRSWALSGSVGRMVEAKSGGVTVVKAVVAVVGRVAAVMVVAGIVTAVVVAA